MDPTTDASTKLKKSRFRRRRSSKVSATSPVADSEGMAEESTRQTVNLSRTKKSKAKRRSRNLLSSPDIAQSPSSEEAATSNELASGPSSPLLESKPGFKNEPGERQPSSFADKIKSSLPDPTAASTSASPLAAKLETTLAPPGRDSTVGPTGSTRGSTTTKTSKGASAVGCRPPSTSDVQTALPGTWGKPGTGAMSTASQRFEVPEKAAEPQRAREAGPPSHLQSTIPGGTKQTIRDKEGSRTEPEGLGTSLHGTQDWHIPGDIGGVGNPSSSQSSASSSPLPAVPFNLRPAVTVDETAKPMRTVISAQRAIAEAEWKTVGVVCLVIVLLLGAATTAVLMVRHTVGTRPRICDSDDCAAHALWLRGLVNRSVDPCEDFAAFTCAIAKPSIGFFGSATDEELLDAWFARVGPLLKGAAGRLSAATKAFAAFGTCMDEDLKDAVTAMGLLRDFMRKRHILWPDAPEDNVSPLGVLLDLAFNWRMTFWMHVQLQRNVLGDRTAMLLSGGNFVKFWAYYHRAVVADDAYENYYNSFARLFAPPGFPSPQPEEVKKMTVMMTDVLEKFLAVRERKRPSPAQFRLRDIASYTPNITFDTWKTALEENVNIPPEFTGSDVIGVSDTAVLTAVNDFFVRYSHGEILRHLGWWFVQTFAPMGNMSVLSAYIKRRADSHRRSVFCGTEVESLYGALISSLYVDALLPHKMRSDVGAVLDNVKKTAVKKLAAISWSDEESKLTAQVKMDQTKVRLWPPKWMLTSWGLNEMYEAFVSRGDTFVGFWLDGFRNLRELKSRMKYDEALDLPTNSLLPLFDYDRLLNTVVVSVAALAPPLYYGHGTPAMIYGGLGFAFSQQLVRAFDSAGIRIDPNGAVGRPWASGRWVDAISKKARCVRHQDPKASTDEDLFPEDPRPRGCTQCPGFRGCRGTVLANDG
ncbi:endothelin-converting enzyme 2-like [Dermacentor silvarum]|uniref:endothelin-converting enzyme 2-like n=1 Tax=Dermacentor silvarum TaxID=543639 RepID=UPI002101AD5B|nr:endothelin-converting enzyme 2-like [Dermacentor silvarum]